MSSSWCSTVKRRAIYERDGGKCGYCGKTISFKRHTIDHIQPRTRGGNNNNQNLITSCMACNQRKGNKTLSEYLQWLILEGYRTNRGVNYIRERVMSMRFRKVVYNAH